MANVFSTATLGLRLDTSTFNNAIRASGLTTQQAFAAMSAGADQFKQKWDDATAGIKDTKRIISGIVISQGFYGIANAATDAAAAILTFSENMETAAVSLEYFMQGSNKAAQSIAYIREMNEFAARTPFGTEAAISLSKYVQSVGIGVDVTKFLLQVVTDAAAATGATEESMQHIVLALGQIQARGRITGKEVRQLANASVPIYQILQEELGLTGDQIAKIGDEWIAADKAIVAILNGLDKRYKGAADRIADTMTGMLDTIMDDSKIIAYEASDGIYGALEDIIRVVRDKLDEYRDIATEFGAAGLFDHIMLEIDPTGQFGTQLLTLVGNTKQLMSALVELYHTSQPLINLFGNGLYGAINMVEIGATALVKTIDGLEKLLSDLGITSGQTGRLLGELFVMYQAGKWAFTLGQGALYAGQSLFSLGKSVVTSLVPSMTMGSQSVLGMVGSLLALAAAGVAVYSILNNLGNFAGLEINTGDILPSSYQSEMDRYLAEMEEYNAEIAKYQESFNEPYSAIGEGTDKAIESYDDLKKASKSAAKSVQHDWTAAFDEVYQVPTFNDPASGGGATAELPKLPDLGKLLTEITFSFPGIPEDALEKPEYDLDKVFENDVFDGNWWRGMLPAVITAGLLGAASWFRGRGSSGPKDIPTGPIGPSGPSNFDLDDIELKKLLKELEANLSELPNDIKQAGLYLTNGDPQLPGVTPTYGADSKAMRALGERIEERLKAIENLEAEYIKRGGNTSNLPENIEAAQMQKMRQQAWDEVIDARADVALERNKILGIAEESVSTAEERQKRWDEILEQIRNKQEKEPEALTQPEKQYLRADARVKRAEMNYEQLKKAPDSYTAANKQQGRIAAGQLREFSITERIKDIEKALNNTGGKTTGEIEDLRRQLVDAQNELAKLMSEYAIAPRYSQLNSEQFIAEFGRMGDKLADNMAYILKTKYSEAAGVDGTFSNDAIELLRQQIAEFKRFGDFATDYYADELKAMADSTGTARRTYAAIIEQDTDLTRMFGQILDGKGYKNGEHGAIERLKDFAAKIDSLTDESLAREAAKAKGAEILATEAIEAANKAAEAEREAKRAADIAQNAKANEQFKNKGTAFDPKTQAAFVDAFQDSFSKSADEFNERLRQILINLVDENDWKYGSAIKNPNLPKGEFGIKLNDETKKLILQLEDVLADYKANEAPIYSDVKNMLEKAYGNVKYDTEDLTAFIADYLKKPAVDASEAAAAAVKKVTDINVRDLIHTVIREQLGYADPALLGDTPKLLPEAHKRTVIEINDIAGMLQGNGPFSDAPDAARRIFTNLTDDTLNGLALRNANFKTTVAGEITQQMSDLIKYTAGQSLPVAGLTVHSGGIIEHAGTLLQVDAVAEGVMEGMKHTMPIQIVGVNENVAKKIANLAGEPVGGVAKLDATTLAAINSEAYYETGALIKAFAENGQDSKLTTGIVAVLNRDLDIYDTPYKKAFEDALGFVPNKKDGYRIFSADSVMSWRNARGLQDLSAKDSVSEYVKRVVLPTFGFFPDLATGNVTATEAERLAEAFQDVNKVAEQFRGSLDVVKDAVQYVQVDFTKAQLGGLNIAGAAAGTNRHVQLLQTAYNTLGNTSELERLMRGYAIMNANAGTLAGAVLEVDLAAPIRQYTLLRQDANKWVSDLTKSNVKFSSSKAVTAEFTSVVDNLMLDYFTALDNSGIAKQGTAYNILTASTKRKLLDVAENTGKFFDLGSDAAIAKQALTTLAENLRHIDPLSMDIKAYVDVLADINRAIDADLVIDNAFLKQFRGLVHNTSSLVERFGLGANEWIQDYIRTLTTLNSTLDNSTVGKNLSEFFNGPLDAMLRIANASETADLAINRFRSMTDGIYDDAIKELINSNAPTVIPTPARAATAIPKAADGATIIDLETFGLPQATKGGMLYPEIFSGAMYNPVTKDMDSFYVLPDNLLDFIKSSGADSPAVKEAVEKYVAGIRDINDEFSKIYSDPAITEDIIARGISKTDAARKLGEWTTSNPNGFTGYNAVNVGRAGGGFDAATIRAFTGTDVSGNAATDVMSLVSNTLRRYTGTDTTLRLTELREMFGITDEMLQRTYGLSETASHTAQADVLVTNEILKRINNGDLASIASTAADNGWKYTTAAGDSVSELKEVLIGIGADRAASTAARTTYFEQARQFGVADEAIELLDNSFNKFVKNATDSGKQLSNAWQSFVKSSDFVDILTPAINTASANAQKAYFARARNLGVSDANLKDLTSFFETFIRKSISNGDAASATWQNFTQSKLFVDYAGTVEFNIRNNNLLKGLETEFDEFGNYVTRTLGEAKRAAQAATTAADLGDVAGTVGAARTAAMNDVGGPSAWNWIRSRFSNAYNKVKDKVTGRISADDFFDATEAAGDTWWERFTNPNLFGGRKASAPTFEDVRQAFKALNAADTSAYAKYGGLTMQQIRQGKNEADMAVAAGTATKNTDWVRDAYSLYDTALKETYGDIAANFNKTVINHIAGQLKDGFAYSSFTELLSKLDDNTKVLATTFGDKLGLIGGTLEISAKQLKNNALLSVFETTAKNGLFGDALKNSDELARAIDVLSSAFNNGMLDGGIQGMINTANALKHARIDSKAATKATEILTEVKEFYAAHKTLEELSDGAKAFVDGINQLGDQVAIVRSTAAGAEEVGDTLLFAGKSAASAIDAAADTLSNSFKSLLSRAVDGVANFGLIDIAVAGISATVQHFADKANETNLQMSMLMHDDTGSVATLANAGYNIGATIGSDIYHGAAEEFGNAIASGVVGSLGVTAGMALGGKVGSTIGTALGAVIGNAPGAVLGKVVGTGIGLGVGFLAGAATDQVIEGMGGHSMTNLYLGDYIDALRDGSLITAEALNDMCEAVGVTAEEIAELGQSAALAKHGVDVGAIELLARNINSAMTMGDADYSKYLEKNDINQVLAGKNSFANYTEAELAARIAAAFSDIDTSLFSHTAAGQYIPEFTVVTDIDAANKALETINKYAGTDYKAGKVNFEAHGQAASVNAVVGGLSLEDLESLKEAVRFTYAQGNKTSDIAIAISSLLNSNIELRKLVAANLYEGSDPAGNAGYAIMAAYDNLDKYLGIYNQAAGTNYTVADISNNWELGSAVQSFASQLVEAQMDMLQAQVMQSSNDKALYNVRPEYDWVPAYDENWMQVSVQKPIAGSILSGDASQTLWGMDLSSMLPEYLDAFSKIGLNFTPGSVEGTTVLSDAQTYNFATLTTDVTALQDAITGWRKDMSNAGLSLDFSNMTITTKDAEILASAGIQINSDGTITFMKAEQDSITGAERNSKQLDYSVFSDYEVDTLSKAGISINTTRDTTSSKTMATGVSLDTESLDSMSGALFKLPDNFDSRASDTVKKALSQIGDIMDSGYIMITDQAVLNGEKSIEAYVKGVVDASDDSSRISPYISSALGSIDDLITKEGDTAINNIKEWADAVVIPSPFAKEDVTDEMKAYFETMGIHFVEYGDQFLMQINQTGEHIKDGSVMLDDDYWRKLVGVDDDHLTTIGQALKDAGVNWETIGNQVMVDLAGTFENGIGNIVSLYTERPDLWDQLPEAIRQTLTQCIVETDNGMLELIQASENGMVKISKGWLADWQALSDGTITILDRNNERIANALDVLRTETDTGMVQIKGVIEKSDISTLLDNEFAIPFSELPKEIQESLTGQEGWSETMRDGLVVVQNVERDELANIVGQAQTAAGDVGTAAGNIVTQIHDAVLQAGIELKNLEKLQQQVGTTGTWPWDKTKNSQGGGGTGYVHGKEVTYVAEYDSKGNFLFYRYVFNDGSGNGTITSKPSTTAPTKRASGGPANGLTLTGELGTEMAILPDGSVKMLGANGHGELVDLPAGTRVLNAEDTKEVLKYTGTVDNVPKLAEGNADLTIQSNEYEENSTFRAFTESTEVSIHGAVTALQETLSNLQDAALKVLKDEFKKTRDQFTYIDDKLTGTLQSITGTNNSTTRYINNADSDAVTKDDYSNWTTHYDQTSSSNTQTLVDNSDSNFSELGSLNSVLNVDSIADADSNMQSSVAAMQDGTAAIVNAIDGLGNTLSTAQTALDSAGQDLLAPQFLFDGISTFEVPTWMIRNYVMDANGEVDWSATAVELASHGYWQDALSALDKRLIKIQELGTDYGNSNAAVYEQAKAAYDSWVSSYDHAANVYGYLSIGNVQDALDEFDLRGYKIGLTGNDGGMSQEALWNERLAQATKLTYKQWLSLHDSSGTSARSSYDPDIISAMFDDRIPTITTEVDEAFKNTANALVNGDRVNLNTFKEFCNSLSAGELATINKNAMAQIEASHQDTVDIVDALKVLQSETRMSLNGLAHSGLSGAYDANGKEYRTEYMEYPGTEINVGNVNMNADYHALMSKYAASGNWSAFDEAAAARDAKISITGNNGGESTSSIAWRLEQAYKRNGSARGSIINEEGLYYAGEEGKQEAIIPLEQPQVLDALGNAIGPYVTAANYWDYRDDIEDASVVIKEANEVAIHGAVAALLEGYGSEKDELIVAITTNTDRIIEALSKVSSTTSAAANAISSGNSSGGNYYDGGASTGKTYTPSVKTPGSTSVSFDTNTDYHALMNSYAAAGNWSAFDAAAAQREAKMAADPSLSKWQATDTLRNQLESLYKRNGSANGSIISEEGLYYAAEQDRQEAIIPLEQPEALTLVGTAISKYVNPDFESIDKAATTIKEANEVAIHGAVAALLEGHKADHDTLLEKLDSFKEAVISAFSSGSLSSQTAASNSVNGSSGSGSYYDDSTYTGKVYTPSVKTPSSTSVSFDANTDYHALMNQYAAAGNWSAFDAAALQRDAKMAADSSLSKWQATDTLRDQLESLYKRNGSASGSIIDEEGLYYAAEQDRAEAIIPLEDPKALATVGAAIGAYSSTLDYTDDIKDAATVIKEANEVAIHGAVAALLEGHKTDHDALLELLKGIKEQLAGFMSSASFGSSGSSSSGSLGGGSDYTGGNSYTGPTYTPSVKTPSSASPTFDTNTDYHALMNKYAAAGNWSAFDAAANQRDAKMAADPSLNRYRATDNIRQELENAYKRNGSAMGSLISAPGLYYAGEQFKQEAILPLEQPSVLSKVGASIASFMPVNMQQQMSMAAGIQNAGIGTTATYAPQPAMDPGLMVAPMVQSVLESVLPQIANMQGESNNDDKRPLYVGTLIADERGLKTLERKLYDIRQVEAGRR